MSATPDRAANLRRTRAALHREWQRRERQRRAPRMRDIAAVAASRAVAMGAARPALGSPPRRRRSLGFVRHLRARGDVRG